tara:strand:+ start:1857 stop:2600 length:744 start_codon:yes stop_codon:yes gene_type:complete
MTDTENAALESTGLARMFDVYKRNRPIQIASVVFVVALISIPIHSYLTAPPADEYQRELEYIVDGEYGVIAWIAETTVELSDGEVFSLTFTEQDFPDEAKNSNVFSVDFYVGVLDNNEDNEETNGLGCAADPGEDALDAVSFSVSTPAGSLDFETQTGEYQYIQLMEYPEFDTYPFITGYTVAEIEEMFDTSDEVVGEYAFDYTGIVESGDSTFQCERQDSSVTIEYMIELWWFEPAILEWNGDDLF